MKKYNCDFCNHTGLFVNHNGYGILCINCMGKGFVEREPDVFAGLQRINNCSKVAILISDNESKILTYEDFFEQYSKKNI